eukprot:scaffold2614_cov244-Pinguiococcus_pyrenoidosus.AAC.1
MQPDMVSVIVRPNPQISCEELRASGPAVLRLNHYPLMALERFREKKIKRSSPDHQKNLRNEGYFVAYDALGAGPVSEDL